MGEQEEPSASPLPGGASGAGVVLAVTSPASPSPTRLARLAIPRFQRAAGSPGDASPMALVGSMGHEPEEMGMLGDSFFQFRAIVGSLGWSFGCCKMPRAPASGNQSLYPGKQLSWIG